QRRFSLRELADAIEEILAEVEPAPLLADVAPNTFLVLRADGTFLHTSNNNPFKQ
ncbi:MAG: hypothetical protein JOZ18_10345, partial [Chloroflexi bacterium]|nr:hypothetical protein [Chloroflexota bacterium]